MTIHRQGPGAVLLLSREELPRPAGEDLLPLVRAALARAGCPAGPGLEILAFPGRRDTLLLVRPAPAEGTGEFFPGLS